MVPSPRARSTSTANLGLEKGHSAGKLEITAWLSCQSADLLVCAVPPCNSLAPWHSTGHVPAWGCTRSSRARCRSVGKLTLQGRKCLCFCLDVTAKKTSEGNGKKKKKALSVCLLSGICFNLLRFCQRGHSHREVVSRDQSLSSAYSQEWPWGLCVGEGTSQPLSSPPANTCGFYWV